MIDGVEEYRKSPVFAGYYIFLPAGHIGRYIEDAIFRFHEIKMYDPIMATTDLLGKLSISVHLKIEMEEFVA